MPTPTDAPPPAYDRRTGDYYDDRWGQEDSAGTPPNEERVGHVVNAVMAHLGGRARPRILDVGCGNGWILAAISDAIGGRAELHGLEPSEVGVRNSQRRVPSAQVYQGLLGQAAVDGKFDLVVCSEVIEHVEDQADFMVQLRSLLDSNGVLILTTPNGRFRDCYFTSPGSKAVPQPVENWLSRKQLLALCDAHFADVRTGTFDASFVTSENAFARVFLSRVVRLRGGWYLRRGIDRLLCARGFGLYHFLTARAQ